ncbi:MAG: hypothetical protein D6702_09405 [Planctomycetota bacterium]|nr:MAG: hypothetical protein D6702_09405 [Planctomycetota bacterium]
MKPILALTPLLLLPALAAGAAQQAVPAEREPWSRTLVAENGMPAKVLEVPEGRRFVLTDLWTFRHDEYPHDASRADRLWLERTVRGNRQVVFDVRLDELPQPMSWRTGMVFGPGDDAWLSYTFAGEVRGNAVRRVFVSGYFEDA